MGPDRRLGVMSAAGAGAGSFSILIGATAQHIPAERRSFAGGVINAGGSLGQFVFAPLNQAVLSAFGWMQAMWMMAAVALTTAPMAWWLRGQARRRWRLAHRPRLTLRQQLKIALRDRSYWCLHAGFFTCGFHIAFLVTHMPGEVSLCGLNANGGRHLAGHHRPGEHRRQPGGRCAGQPGAHEAHPVLDVCLARGRDPRLPGRAQGALDLLPLRRGARRHLAGHRAADGRADRQAVRHALPRHAVRADLLSHQIGGFFGAWLGGLAAITESTGSYRSGWMWWAVPPENLCR
jgi:hypothetical protein